MKSYFNISVFAIVGAMVCFAGANANDDAQAQDGYVRMNFTAKAKSVGAKTAFAGGGYMLAYTFEKPLLTFNNELHLKNKIAKENQWKCFNKQSAVVTFIGIELLLHAYADDTAPIKFVTDSRLVKYVADQMPEDLKDTPKAVAKELTYFGVSLLVAYCAPLFIDGFNSN